MTRKCRMCTNALINSSSCNCFSFFFSLPSCSAAFWVGLRRHHCRSCGLVVCSRCSSRQLPVPREQLFEPVRVCDTCYIKLEAEHAAATAAAEEKDNSKMHKQELVQEAKECQS